MRSAGQVRVLGVDPAHGDERWRARLGVVLQSWRDHGRWRVRDLLDHLGGFYAPYATPERPRPWYLIWPAARLAGGMAVIGFAAYAIGTPKVVPTEPAGAVGREVERPPVGRELGAPHCEPVT